MRKENAKYKITEESKSDFKTKDINCQEEKPKPRKAMVSKNFEEQKRQKMV